MADVVRVRIRRSDPGAQRAFAVGRIEPMTVLDALLAVQRDHDPTLGLRFSCRVAMCGTCTVRRDGRAVLACQERIEPTDTEVLVGPVAGLPVIRDLLVDFRPFWDEWARVTPFLVPREDLDAPARIAPDAAERQRIDPALDCIGCAACWSGCGVATAGRDFLGPAALNRAMVLVEDSRDAAADERLDLVSGSDGVDRCHYVYACTAVCPKGLDPAGAIRRLRERR